MSTVQNSDIKYTHVKTPQAENDNKSDYKRFKSHKKDKRQDLHYRQTHTISSTLVCFKQMSLQNKVILNTVVD